MSTIYLEKCVTCGLGNFEEDMGEEIICTTCGSNDHVPMNEDEIGEVATKLSNFIDFNMYKSYKQRQEAEQMAQSLEEKYYRDKPILQRKEAARIRQEEENKRREQARLRYIEQERLRHERQQREEKGHDMKVCSRIPEPEGGVFPRECMCLPEGRFAIVDLNIQTTVSGQMHEYDFKEGRTIVNPSSLYSYPNLKYLKSYGFAECVLIVCYYASINKLLIWHNYGGNEVDDLQTNIQFMKCIPYLFPQNPEWMLLVGGPLAVENMDGAEEQIKAGEVKRVNLSDRIWHLDYLPLYGHNSSPTDMFKSLKFKEYSRHILQPCKC
jgi:hypothetical protein